MLPDLSGSRRPHLTRMRLGVFPLEPRTCLSVFTEEVGLRVAERRVLQAQPLAAVCWRAGPFTWNLCYCTHLENG